LHISRVYEIHCFKVGHVETIEYICVVWGCKYEGGFMVLEWWVCGYCWCKMICWFL